MRTINNRDSTLIAVTLGLLITIGIFLYGNYSTNYDPSGLTTVLYWMIAFLVFAGCIILLASFTGSELNKKFQKSVVSTKKRLTVEVLASYLLATSMFLIGMWFSENLVSDFLIRLAILVTFIGTIRLYSLISIRFSKNWPFTSDKQQSALITVTLVGWAIVLFL